MQMLFCFVLILTVCGSLPFESPLLQWPMTQKCQYVRNVGLLWNVVTSVEPGKTCCSHSRFHHPQQVVIIALLCKNAHVFFTSLDKAVLS